MRGKIKPVFYGSIMVLVLIVLTSAAWIYNQVDSSQAILDGEQMVFGLTNNTTINRDKHGVVTIHAKNRQDAALALGFTHSQERFFQMDLLRRNSAGELSSLFGEMALDYDKSIRNHRFRERARRIIKNLPDEQLAILKSYTRGVNAGLNTLKAAPFEYLILQQEPIQWREEDTLLTVFSMYIDLQQHDGRRERSLGIMKKFLPDDIYQFLTPRGTPWDAAIDDSHLGHAELPTSIWPQSVDLSTSQHRAINNLWQDLPAVGSNNWAVDSSISQRDSAIVANDMHLGLRVPNTWFRASINYQEEGKSHTITGATLPGAPNIIVGSNSKIAWGFTNSYGDWSDIITLELSKDKRQYLTPDGYKPLMKHKEVIAISDGQTSSHTVTETHWGPVIGKDPKGNLLVYRWVAHDINAVNLNLLAMETAVSVDEALSIAAKTGIPAQNLMVADRKGNIAWTIMGPIPKRSTEFGQVPTSWADGTYQWLNYLSEKDYPVIKNPSSSFLWTANSRIVGGEMYKKLGDGGYALGARAQQIRDNLSALTKADEQALLDVGLDTRALFLDRWHKLATKTLSHIDNLNHSELSKVTMLLADENLSATTNSVAYRLVRQFRLNTINYITAPLTNWLTEQDEHFNANAVYRRIEQPVWQLITEQPNNFPLVDDSWQKLLNRALVDALESLTANSSIENATWGAENTSAIKHPLSSALPILSSWLDMPQLPLAGDKYMPRIQGKSFGASQRMVVSPGNEAQGIFHMPTGQSGHPWSPFYRAGHNDWVNATSSPFLPGEVKHTLTLNAF